MLKVAVLFTRLLLNDMVEADSEFDRETRILCDNGEYATDKWGNPNYRCIIDGCRPNSESCWEERTQCELLICPPLVAQGCSGKYSCFWRWLGCDSGTWLCHEKDGIGCDYGDCVNEQ